jgi:hypothetical protein
MNKKILIKAIIMGAGWPLAVFLVCALLDIATQESRAALYVMFAEGIVLFVLPILMLKRERKLSEEKLPLWTVPVYLAAYALITVLLHYLIEVVADTSVFFSKDVYMGGLGLVLMLMILTGGFIWAVVFRLGAAVVGLIRGKRQ